MTTFYTYLLLVCVCIGILILIYIMSEATQRQIKKMQFNKNVNKTIDTSFEISDEESVSDEDIVTNTPLLFIQQ